MRQTISTPWGEIHVIVQQGRDATWYAVLRDQPEPGLFVGGVGASAELAVAQLAAQCRRLPRPRSSQD